MPARRDITNALQKPSLLILAFLALMGPIVILATNAWQKVEMLAIANSDSAQWTWSQLEVEFLKLEAASASAITTGNLDELRRTFDVLYNRINVLRAVAPDFDRGDGVTLALALEELESKIQAKALVLDASDDILAASLPAVISGFAELRQPIRTISLSAVAWLSESSDEQRAAVRETLLHVTAATSGLLVLLLLGVLLLLKLTETARRKGQHALDATLKLEAIVSASLDGIVVSNVEGKIQEFNERAERIFGFSRDDVLGKRMSDYIVPAHLRSAHDAGMARYQASGEKRMLARGRLELEAVRHSGELFPIELSVRQAQLPNGEVFVAYIRDVSAEKSASQALQRAREDAEASARAKADLLTVMSHEMRTPLNGILGALDLIKTRTYDQEFSDYLKIMEDSGEILLGHINDVLQISRLDAGLSQVLDQPFNVMSLIDEVINVHRALAISRGNEIKAIWLCDVKDFVGDAPKLRQILMNLVSNAVKFTRDGQIFIEVERFEGTQTVEFRVRDEGIGVASADLRRIFDDFFIADSSYSREFGGTGLGLAITARLVHALGGKIDAESVLGEGSSFRVSIPLRVARPPAEGRDSSGGTLGEPEPSLPSLEILLAEDSPINQRIAKDMLVLLGQRVTVAGDGAEAVRLAAQSRFELILMDINMPRLHGLDAARRIRERGASRHARIIALTAHAGTGDVSRFRDAGLDATITKPININRLREILGGEFAFTGEDEIIGSEEWIDRSIQSEIRDIMGFEGLSRAWSEFSMQSEAVMTKLNEISLGGAIDVEDIERVHRLAGSAAVIGASRFACVLRALEDALVSDHGASSSDLAKEALVCWNSTRKVRDDFFRLR